jgi:cytochrome c-type biogenesis protein CcmH
MTLWFAMAMMTAAAIFAVLWPLARRHDASAAGHPLNVYRDQLDEVERDRAAGLIGAEEADAARIEVSRRLLASADQPVASTVSAPRRRRIVALAALLLLPLGAASLYLALGSPGLPGQSVASRSAAPDPNASLDGLIAQVEARLAEKPDDGRGWEVLAPVYLRLGRQADAVMAWRNALAFNGETAERQSNLGEALVAAANGVVTAEAKAAFTRAQELDGGDMKARYFLGLAAEQDGNAAEAAALWRAMLAQAPPDAPWLTFVRAALRRVEAAGAGPSDDDIAATAQLPAEQRNEMVRGMVERLAERMKQDGSNVEGWARLLRSYVVLGEHDKARAALDDARRAVANDTDKSRQLNELAHALGLEG